MPLGDLTAGLAGTDGNFVARVNAEVISASAAILSEAASVQDHLIRVKFARKVKRGEVPIPPLAIDVAMQSGPQSASTLATVTDSQIATAVSGLWNQWADAHVQG